MTAFQAHLQRAGLVQRAHPEKQQAAGRVFLGRVRHCTNRCRFTPAAWACWRAIISKRASEIGLPLVGGGAALSQRLFPAVSLRRRLAAGGLSGAGLLQPADRADAATPTARRSTCASICRTTRSSARSGGRTSAASRFTCSTPTCRKTRPADRDITAALRRRHRDAHQAGDRAGHRRRPRSRRSNIEPTVFHMNEGHAAFLALERIRVLLEQHAT